MLLATHMFSLLLLAPIIFYLVAPLPSSCLHFPKFTTHNTSTLTHPPTQVGGLKTKRERERKNARQEIEGGEEESRRAGEQEREREREERKEERGASERERERERESECRCVSMILSESV